MSGRRGPAARPAGSPDYLEYLRTVRRYSANTLASYRRDLDRWSEFCAEYFGVGLGSIALTAYIARETSKAFTATQFALFSSFIAVPRTFANASTGYLIEAMGYTSFFLLCTAVAVPGMLLLFKVAPWNAR